MRNIKKEITFICTDNVERQCCEPVALEAEKRGYKTKFTDNQFTKCEIAFYISHVNYPKYSKFSIVSLHDLGQQHGEWPVMWKNEFWSQFDIAFLPSKEWADMWHNASCYNFVRPRSGCYLSGWIKADKIIMQDFSIENEKIIKEYGIDTSKKTVLYAPAWEWDGHQLEIANAVRDLDVNLIIKQFPFDSRVFPWEVKLIEETHEKTRALGLDNVFILDPKINIFNAIQIADVLVSEESSTLSEAMLLGKNVVAVEDWLVPDSYPKPARNPECFYDFAINIKKNDLRNTIIKIISDESYKEKVIAYRNENFPNIGHAAKIVMDVLDNVLYGKNNNVPRIEELPLVSTPSEYKKAVARRKKIMKRIYIKKNFVDKNKILLNIWNFLRMIKHSLKKSGGGYNSIVYLQGNYCAPSLCEAA